MRSTKGSYAGSRTFYERPNAEGESAPVVFPALVSKIRARRAPAPRSERDKARPRARSSSTRSGRTLPSRVAVRDTLDRPLKDLRISLTDRCNFRCRYCMPREVFGAAHSFLPTAQTLSFDQIERVSRVLADLGVEKIRLTGGEPLLRPGIADLVSRLARVTGIRDLTMTTNASMLAQKAPALAEAGLGRVTVSLDALDPDVFAKSTDARVPVDRVLAGIEAADRAGLRPVKINAVIRRGVNDDQIEALAERFRGTGCVVRFIEYMDVGNAQGWDRSYVVPAAEIVERIDARHPLEPISPARPGEVATRYRYADGGGEIGVIASVTEPFCGTCTRLRLSAEGMLYTCLFAETGHDLVPLLARGADDEAIAAFVERLWRGRADRYSETRHERTVVPLKVEMSYIGG